jgi:endonuclease/exonuclease/phosphatase family metal-dependent hydrolase
LGLHNAHAPPGSTRYQIRPQALAAIARRLDGRPSTPQILCGDFNTPQPEVAGEPVRTFADRYPAVAAEWDAAETRHPRPSAAARRLQAGACAGRSLAGSHRVRNSRTPDRRYDHIYVSEHFTVDACRYLSDWLDAGLSDHAAVEADLRVCVYDAKPRGRLRKASTSRRPQSTSTAI